MKTSRKIGIILILILAVTFVVRQYFWGTSITHSVVLKLDTHIREPLESIQGIVTGDAEIFPLTIRLSTPRGDVIKELSVAASGSFSFPAGGPAGILSVSAFRSSHEISGKDFLRLAVKNKVISGDAILDTLFPRVEAWMRQDVSMCEGTRGYRSPDTETIWLRDHTYQMSAFKYWESDMKGTIDAFLAAQREDGELPDFLCPYRVRATVEADVEYLSVIDAYQVWQATGDDEWIKKQLPKLEKALQYSMTDRDRWSTDHGLLKRGFTIDMWDFQWGFGSNTIRPETKFGMIVSDNSGLYLASRYLALLNAQVGNTAKAKYWNTVADDIRTNSNRYLWDEERGYYRSFVHIDDPIPAVDSDERDKLTLGNTYAMNRADFTSHEQSVRIISEYQKRKDRAFKEWFSINPNYGNNKFNSGSQAERAGGYVNGGIMPLVGGELARAAFANGYESYALDQLRYYIDMTTKAGNLPDGTAGKTYLWYWPDGQAGKDDQTIPTDGWGSSAMLAAFVEGLVGIHDTSKLFEHILLTPRWAATTQEHVTSVIRYGASDAYVAYREIIDRPAQVITLEITGSPTQGDFRVLLPESSRAERITVNDKNIDFTNEDIGTSHYAIFSSSLTAFTTIRIELQAP